MSSSRITFSGKIWQSPNEIIPKVYNKIAADLKKGMLKYGSQFEYPILAEALRDNHYYLKENNILPEYFIISESSENSYGFQIRFFSPKFESEDKTREIEVQKANNFIYKRDLLIRRIQSYMDHRKEKILQNAKECEYCGKSKSPRELDVIYKNFDLEFLVNDKIQEFQKAMLYSAVQVNYEKSDRVHLSMQNGLVQRLLQYIAKVPFHVSCSPCQEKITRAQFMEELKHPTTNELRVRQILRQYTRKNMFGELVSLCSMITENISSGGINAPGFIKQMWFQLHFIAADLFEHEKSHPFFEQWNQISLRTENTNSWIDEGFFRMCYRVDDPQWNQILYPRLFGSKHNIFAFFREMGQYLFPADLLAYIIKKELFIEFPKSLISCIQGLLYTRQKPVIQDLLANFDKYLPELQSLFIQELFNAGIDSGFELLEKIVKDPNKKVDPLIQALFESRMELYKKTLAQQELDNNITKARIKEETAFVKQEYELWRKKRGPSPNQMHEIAGKLVNQKYKPLIEQYINSYRGEFEQYFAKHPKPVAALDIEEWNFRMFCVLAVEIKPDLRVFVKLMAVEDIFPIEKFTPPLRAQIRNWLKTLSGSIVINHGSNEEEAKMIEDSGHIQVNTQDILHRVRFSKAGYAASIQGEGLKHFEEFLKFSRSFCPFLKHEIQAQLFFQEAALSMDHHLTETPQRACSICHKEQDVLAYCLEDAFSSLLIYIYFQNHEPDFVGFAER